MARVDDADAVLVEHRRLIEAVARRVCAGHPDDVEDVVQEASLRICRSLHTVRHRQALVAWVMQTTRNAAIGYLSRTRWKHRGEVPLDEATAPHDHVDPPLDPTSIDRTTDVRQAVDALPPLEQRAIRARYGIDADETIYRDVAQEFGVSEPTVDRAVSRATRRLRVRLWSHADDPS